MFTALKWLGAAYLVYLGVRLWRAGGRLDAGPRETSASARTMLGHAFAVTALNTKSITFFVAFLPQFLDPARGLLWQLVVMEATFRLFPMPWPRRSWPRELAAWRATSVRCASSTASGQAYRSAPAASLGLRTTQG